MSYDELVAELAAILEEVAGVDATRVRPEQRFAEDLELDSLSIVEVTATIEDKLSVRIPEEDMPAIQTVGDAADYLLRSNVGS